MEDSIPDNRRNKPHSSICKNIPSKTVVCICDSGHVSCENCQNLEMPRQNCRDSITYIHLCKKRSKTKCVCSNTKNKKHLNDNFAFRQDSKTIEKDIEPDNHKNITPIEKNKRLAQKKVSLQVKTLRQTTEMEIKYRNENYNDSLSSVDSTKVRAITIPESDSVPRTISCPVCAKVVIINSIMYHFYFDHSKVPRLTLKNSGHKHIILKVSDFGIETKCLAILLQELNKKYKDDDNNNTKEIKVTNSFGNVCTKNGFLMGTKIAHKVSTQLDKDCNQETDILKKKDITQNTCIHDNDNIMIWVCKQNDDEMIYNVTLSRDDKKLSFSYTGEAYHVREKQDLHAMYENVSCLILKGKAINRLISTQGQIHLFVSLR